MKKVVIFLVFLVLSVVGCGAMEQIIITDPSHLLVLFEASPKTSYDPGEYEYEIEGAINVEMKPGQSIERNMACVGDFEIRVHAYKVVGRTASGKAAREYMGWRKIPFATTGRSIYRRDHKSSSGLVEHKHYDTIVTFSEHGYQRETERKVVTRPRYLIYANQCGWLSWMIPMIEILPR
ncbi:hypothetical protein HY839_01085 [Candidatus Azambacteria bacterium]|nr:hypothetical protein [Candidatus Azambacteria bacterium]